MIIVKTYKRNLGFFVSILLLAGVVFKGLGMSSTLIRSNSFKMQFYIDMHQASLRIKNFESYNARPQEFRHYKLLSNLYSNQPTRNTTDRVGYVRLNKGNVTYIMPYSYKN